MLVDEEEMVVVFRAQQEDLKLLTEFFTQTQIVKASSRLRIVVQSIGISFGFYLTLRLVLLLLYAVSFGKFENLVIVPCLAPHVFSHALVVN